MKQLLVFVALLLIPSAAHAQSIFSLLLDIERLAQLAINLLLAIAVLIFIWALVQYITKTDEVENRKELKQIMLWGIIALAVAVSLWGLVEVLQNTFLGGDGGSAIPPPSASGGDQ